MIGQKLIKILQTLDPTAFRRLGDAIASPYFTYSPLLLKLYALLKKEYPEFDSTRLSAALGLVKPPIRPNATPQHVVFTGSALRKRRVKTPRHGVGPGMEEEAEEDRAQRKTRPRLPAELEAGCEESVVVRRLMLKPKFGEDQSRKLDFLFSLRDRAGLNIH